MCAEVSLLASTRLESRDDAVMSIRLVEVTAVDRSGWLAVAQDGHPVGTAFVRSPADGAAELELNVHPAERRTGTGTRLLEAALGGRAPPGFGPSSADRWRRGRPTSGSSWPGGCARSFG